MESDCGLSSSFVIEVEMPVGARSPGIKGHTSSVPLKRSYAVTHQLAANSPLGVMAGLAHLHLVKRNAASILRIAVILMAACGICDAEI